MFNEIVMNISAWYNPELVNIIILFDLKIIAIKFNWLKVSMRTRSLYDRNRLAIVQINRVSLEINKPISSSSSIFENLKFYHAVLNWVQQNSNN